MVCTADLMKFQMPVLIGATSFFVSNGKFVWKSRGIYSLKSGNPVNSSSDVRTAVPVSVNNYFRKAVFDILLLLVFQELVMQDNPQDIS
jgi:hypothetical protein